MSPGQPVSVSTSSGGQSLLGAGSDCITIPGPGAEGCGPVGTSYSYTQFPTTLNKVSAGDESHGIAAVLN